MTSIPIAKTSTLSATITEMSTTVIDGTTVYHGTSTVVNGTSVYFPITTKVGSITSTEEYTSISGTAYNTVSGSSYYTDIPQTTEVHYATEQSSPTSVVHYTQIINPASPYSAETQAYQKPAAPYQEHQQKPVANPAQPLATAMPIIDELLPVQSNAVDYEGASPSGSKSLFEPLKILALMVILPLF